MGAFPMGSRKLLLLVANSRAKPDLQGTVTHLRGWKNTDCGRNPQDGHLDRPRWKRAPARKRNRCARGGLFVRKACFGCHGETGSGGPAPTLIRSDGKSKSPYPCLTPCVNDSNPMAFHSPYATTIWDYINRAMPLTKEGTLKPNEVYALTAYILFKNGIIKEDEVMDAQSLPKVKMPNRDHVGLAPEWKHGTPRLQGYP